MTTNQEVIHQNLASSNVNQTRPTSRVPFEIFLEVGKHLRQDDAINAGAASKEWHAKFRPAIWRALQFHKDNHSTLGEDIGRFLGRVRDDLDKINRGDLRCRPFVEDIQTLDLYLQYHDTDDWEHEDTKPAELGNMLVDLLSNLPKVRKLNLDLRDMEEHQVARMVNLLRTSAQKSRMLARIKQVRFITGELDAKAKRQTLRFDSALCGRLITAICGVLGPDAEDLEFLRGSSPPNNQVLLEAFHAFTTVNHRRHLRRVLIAGTTATHGFGVIGAREILEQIVQPDKDAIETVFVGDDADYKPAGGKKWKDMYEMIEHLVTALGDKPRLRRVAFPVLDFRAAGAEKMTDDINFEREPVERAMEVVVEGVMERCKQLEHVAFWSLCQNRGDDWVRPTYGGGEKWPMGLWGYRW
ncbi:hypothetical protein QBC40DRAFT_311295 [Triangularia verruculosa]|uniref:F-box domain-containing protein n=1 Tax=Triangularia verruculosa TaxID=2587418 RepID=A0AAN7AQC8_9PEZI|nr:hypothetical protein QBC40DRAFT_311295 [Triangularia verruculosa]